MLRTQENITNVIIAKDIALTVSAGDKATPASLAVGEVVITDISMDVLDTTTVLGKDKVFIVQGRGANKALKKYLIVGKETHMYLGSPYSAPVEQISTIGYNGTSGAIDVINNNTYIVRINRRPNHFVRGNNNWYKYLSTTSDATATQAEIAAALARSFAATFYEDRKLENWIGLTVLSSAAGAAIGGTFTDLVFTSKSKTVGIIGGNVTLVPGDFVRVGTLTADPVYKVAAVNSPNTITLEVPYEGATATVPAAGLEVVTAAAAAASNFGLVLTGRPYKFDLYRWGAYEKARFVIGLENFGVTVFNTPVAAEEGNGTYPQVALCEWESWANDGQTFIEQTPILIREKDADEAGEYGMLEVVQMWKENRMISNGGLRSSLLIAVDQGGANTQVTGSAESFGDVLDAYLGQFAFAPQVGNI